MEPLGSNSAPFRLARILSKVNESERFLIINVNFQQQLRSKTKGATLCE